MDAQREQKSRRMNILLVNLHSSCNAGDDALTDEAVRQLAEQFPEASFTLAMNDPDSYRGRGQALGSFTSWVKPIPQDGSPSRWRWRAFPALVIHSLLAVAGYRLTRRPWYPFLPAERRVLLQSYFRADMVISAAGNFLYTSGMVGLPFLLALFTIYYGRLAGKPLYTLPQTLGPIRRRWERRLAKAVLSRTRLVLIRDPISEEVWRTWNVQGPRWTMLPDLAFARPCERDTQEALALLEEYGLRSNQGRPWLGVTLIHWGAQSRTFDRQRAYEETIEAAIRDFVTTHAGRAILFAQVQGPTQAEDDREPARRVLARLEDLADQVVLIDRRVTPPVLKATYGQMDLFLGTRLHSNIFALTEGVPVLAIGYQYKTRGVLRLLNLEEWVLDIEAAHREALLPLLHKAWAERENIRAHLQKALPVVREQASRAGALVASDFHSLCSEANGGEQA
jgi:colanic acid/amylovoran biosynthesis protein